jgi:glycosyltransferase involved in cell wall biosynthesis
VDRSLSFILTVHNAAPSLDARVTELLELAAELTPDFELLVVDDGSTDSTEEVAHEMARAYPQLQVVRHQPRQGPIAAAETGMQHARGKVALVQDIHEPTSTSDLKRLWRLRDQHDSLVVHRRRDEAADMPTLPERLRARATGTLSPATMGLQMIRRDAAERWQRHRSPAVYTEAVQTRTENAV